MTWQLSFPMLKVLGDSPFGNATLGETEPEREFQKHECPSIGRCRLLDSSLSIVDAWMYLQMVCSTFSLASKKVQDFSRIRAVPACFEESPRKTETILHPKSCSGSSL